MVVYGRITPDTTGSATGPGLGTNRDLYLKMYGGMVLNAFSKHNLFRDLIRYKDVGAGKSWQFPLAGAMKAVWFQPGEDLITEGGAHPNAKYLSDPEHQEVEIAINGILQSSYLEHDIDRMEKHFDLAAEYAARHAEALSQEEQLWIMRTIFKGSGDPGQVDSGDASTWKFGGYRVEDDDFSQLNGGVYAAGSPSASSIKATIKDIALTFSKRYVPKNGRVGVVPPDTFHELANDSDVVNRDTNARIGGSLADGGTVESLYYSGFTIYENNLFVDFQGLEGSTDPASDLVRGTDYGTTAIGDDFGHLKGLFWQRENAVGAIRQSTIETSIDWDHRTRAHLVFGGIKTGHGVLHSSACAAVTHTT